MKERGRTRLKVSAVKDRAPRTAPAIYSDELLSLIDSPCFLFSTNGAIFGHPDSEAVQRVIARSIHQPPTLYFNYLSETTRPWKNTELQKSLKYNAIFNPTEDAPFSIEL